MARKLKFDPFRGGARGELLLSGSIVTGAAGAITSVTGFVPSAVAGASPGVVKTAAKTARYTVTLDRKYAALRFVGAPAIVGPTDAGIGNASGNTGFYRNRTTNSFDIQIALASSGADTELTNPSEIHWAVVVREI